MAEFELSFCIFLYAAAVCAIVVRFLSLVIDHNPGSFPTLGYRL